MSEWTFDEIARVACGQWLIAPAAEAKPPIRAAIDSREIEAGMLFVAFKGERVDGHRYLDQAQRSGAAMAIATDTHAVPSQIEMPVLLVDDATDALERLASRWREILKDLRVIGVTGSNGKTTTCRLLFSAACSGERGFAGSRTRKSYNNAIGVPLTLLNATPDDRVLVCEMGMSTPGEIAARCRTARPDAAIITTVSGAHLEGLGSIESIAREKASIAAELTVDAPLFIPSGIDILEEALGALPNRPRVIRVGLGTDHELALLPNVGTGTRFVLDGHEYEIGLDGAHNAMNASLAVLAARWLGASQDCIRIGLAGSQGPPMRLERSVVKADPPIMVINDAYNANLASMRAALDVLATTDARGRRVAVLGDMLELGASEADMHAEILKEAEHREFLVLTLGPRFAAIRGEVEKDTGREAVGRIADQINPGDAVLLKGSRGMRVERVLDELRVRFENTSWSDRSKVDA